MASKIDANIRRMMNSMQDIMISYVAGHTDSRFEYNNRIAREVITSRAASFVDKEELRKLSDRLNTVDDWLFKYCSIICDICISLLNSKELIKKSI